MRTFGVIYGVILAAVAALAIAGGVIVFGRSGPDGAIASLAARYDYNIPAWEVRHLAGKFLYNLGHLFDSGSSPAEEEAILRRYFQLGQEIAAPGRSPNYGGDPGAQARRSPPWQERRELENRVEAILEGRLTDLFREQ